MMKDIIVTTTNNIDGTTVEKYLGIVVSNQVLGVNFFSDFMAGITDFIGGNSITYQNKMNRLYQSGISQIQEKARKLQADAVIGVKMDFDEISGQGKSMFMYSISGTAVKFKRNDSPLVKPEREYDENIVYTEDLKIELFKQQWLEKPCRLTQEQWDVICAYKIEEFAEPLLKIVAKSHLADDFDSMKASYCQYLQEMPNIDVTELLYANIRNYPDAICAIIKDLKLFNAEKIVEFIKDGKLSIACKLLKVEKDFYTKDDILGCNSIIEALDNLPEKGKIIEVKKGFLSEPERKYMCPLHHENESYTRFCTSSGCGQDIKGLTSENYKTISDFKERIAMIKSLLKINE